MEEFSISKKKIVLIVILIIVAMIGTGFASGEIQALYNRTTGVHEANSETDQFHATQAYVDGMVQDLSKYQLEYEQSKDTTAKNAIVSHIDDEFANFDENRIQNSNLRAFLEECRNGGNN